MGNISVLSFFVEKINSLHFQSHRQHEKFCDRVAEWEELLIDEPKVRRLRPADHFFAKMGQPRPRMLSAGLELGLSE